MKKTLILVLALMVASVSSYAQSIKFANVNADEIVSLMPETDSAKVKVDAHLKNLQKEMEVMQLDLQKKYDTYTKNASQYSDAMRQQKEKEINDTQNTIKEFQQVAQMEMQQKQQEFMAPVFDKVNAAIKKVSQANHITFVMDKTQPPFIYVEESAVTDITALVKKELGL